MYNIVFIFLFFQMDNLILHPYLKTVLLHKGFLKIRLKVKNVFQSLKKSVFDHCHFVRNIVMLALLQYFCFVLWILLFYVHT